jgi:hypothetical protein
MHPRIKIWQHKIAIFLQCIPKSVAKTIDLRKSYVIKKRVTVITITPVFSLTTASPLIQVP